MMRLMNRRSWMAGGMGLMLTGCGAAVGVGSNGVDHLASTTVRTRSSSAIHSAVTQVFRAQGFSVLSSGQQSITFVKNGGRSAEIAWTTLDNPNPLLIRPTVTWRKEGASDYWLGCQVRIAQQSTVEGETVREPMLMGKSAYQGMLRQVKSSVEAGR